MKKITLLVTLLVAMLLFTACGECEHAEWSNWEVTTASTCTEQGVETRNCVECGEKETRSVELEAHSYSSWTTVTAATCTTQGRQESKCLGCGDTKTENVSAKGHSYGNYITVKSATCSSAGSKESKCSGCGDTKTQSISALGHNWSAATCTKAKTCKTCNTTSGSALGHTNNGAYICKTCSGLMSSCPIVGKWKTIGASLDGDPIILPSTYGYITIYSDGTYYMNLNGDVFSGKIETGAQVDYGEYVYTVSYDNVSKAGYVVYTTENYNNIGYTFNEDYIDSDMTVLFKK